MKSKLSCNYKLLCIRLLSFWSIWTGLFFLEGGHGVSPQLPSVRAPRRSLWPAKTWWESRRRVRWQRTVRWPAGLSASGCSRTARAAPSRSGVHWAETRSCRTQVRLHVTAAGERRQTCSKQSLFECVWVCVWKRKRGGREKATTETTE